MHKMRHTSKWTALRTNSAQLITLHTMHCTNSAAGYLSSAQLITTIMHCTQTQHSCVLLQCTAHYDNNAHSNNAWCIFAGCIVESCMCGLILRHQPETHSVHTIIDIAIATITTNTTTHPLITTLRKIMPTLEPDTDFNTLLTVNSGLHLVVHTTAQQSTHKLAHAWPRLDDLTKQQNMFRTFCCWVRLLLSYT